MRRYVFINPHNKFDIRVIETYRNLSEIEEQVGYTLFSIEKLKI